MRFFGVSSFFLILFSFFAIQKIRMWKKAVSPVMADEYRACCLCEIVVNIDINRKWGVIHMVMNKKEGVIHKKQVVKPVETMLCFSCQRGEVQSLSHQSRKASHFRENP